MMPGRADPAVAAQATRSTLIERVALTIFYVFTAMSVVGYAVFGLHPELLAQTPSAVKVYSVAFTFFPRAHVLLGFATLGLVLIRRTGVRWLPAFAACYVLSLGSELAGTTVGLPFGPYHYTPGLGTKWFGHVPVLIPLSWFFMALPSYLLARAALAREARGQRAGRVITIAVGSLVLLAWDLALDPAMSWITKYWVWGQEGPYYGMPLLNLFGWYATGIALMIALALLGADSWGESIPVRWLLGYYGANLLLPLGMIAAAGLWWAVLFSVAAVGASLWLPRLYAPRLRRRAGAPLQEAA
jgi:uncharacterized membrane protein